MPFPTGEEEEVSNVALMQNFLRALYELLGGVLQEGRDSKGQPLFFDPLLAPLREGFGDMDRHFANLHQAIEKIPDERIRDHALEGRQLSLKLRIVRFFADRFEMLGGPGPLRRLLDTIEGLLDSILDAAGTGGAVKEFKDFVRNATAG